MVLSLDIEINVEQTLNSISEVVRTQLQRGQTLGPAMSEATRALTLACTARALFKPALTYCQITVSQPKHYFHDL